MMFIMTYYNKTVCTCNQEKTHIPSDNVTQMNELTLQIKEISHRLGDVIGIENA